MAGSLVAGVSFLYLFGLFGIAYWADLRADQGRNVIAKSSVYALSLAVYCTTWTFYGSVGRASSVGLGFLPIYLGPTLMMTLGFVVLAKILRIAKRQRTTSIADFIAARYGKSQVLGGIVALVAVIAITPYIALQLKAVSVSFDVISGLDPSGRGAGVTHAVAVDKALYVAIGMAAFAIVFGTRHIDAAEHHPGMVAAVAFESLIKLVSFMAVGAFVTFGLYDGFGDLFSRAFEHPEILRLYDEGPALTDGNWFAITVLAMLAIICLPRQFQIMVIENTDERHLGRALWLFPLYMLLINIFVLPLTVAGLLMFPDRAVDPDMFVLALPLAKHWYPLAMFAYVGGLSAATSMIIVESIALSTMVCNDLVMPVLLRMRSLALDKSADLSRLLLAIRRVTIVVILLLGYAYVRFAGSAYALVAIGLISFAGVAQFAPALIGGIFWSGATRRGAIAGLTAGILAWAYTLLLPSFARSGWLPAEFIEYGPWGLELLRPYTLFGLEGLEPLTHCLFWSGLFNIGLYIGVSMFDRPSISERVQATVFVEVFQQSDFAVAPGRWRGSATIDDLRRLVSRFVGAPRANQAFAQYTTRYGMVPEPQRQASADMVRFAERLLAGAIGAASARVALASAVKDTEFSIPELMRMLDETSHVIEYSRQLEQKSSELERTSAALRAANEQLRELDRMKDDFLSTMTHELRTPLTSIRAFSEILFDDPDIELDQRQEFLGLIIKESERLTRLINQVLDFAKIEAGQVTWRIEPVDLAQVMEQAGATTSQLFREKGVALKLNIGTGVPPVRGDYDRLMQVAVNLLSNAVKFTPENGRVTVGVAPERGGVRVSVADSGPGIAAKDAEIIFERFRQVGNTMTSKPQGTGLGLAICRKIVDHLQGRIWVESELGRGATFCFVVPCVEAMAAPAAAIA
ncbi:MAG: histidine kinase [Azospirillum sp.]|nr:histidine kinase [Azospirillum sp.]